MGELPEKPVKITAAVKIHPGFAREASSEKDLGEGDLFQSSKEPGYRFGSCHTQLLGQQPACGAFCGALGPLSDM
ncbi:similar to hypothetical protein MGC14141 (predicted), isoform CRA_d [Rattus norvegicus]|uniref:Uncharacterized protein RGD1561492_predicted n=1 Tax=Rattus norvegicus TaxID=10116 RepID=A6JT89_RAT|nr:similar to hypothetical protein MGC14141 (predicted), isoform CRA_d [Rattus norvegicus]